jgi:hypothetical protein
MCFTVLGGLRMKPCFSNTEERPLMLEFRGTNGNGESAVGNAVLVQLGEDGLICHDPLFVAGDWERHVMGEKQCVTDL